jgi:hypothetical protein
MANYVVNVIGSLYKRIITDWELSELRHPTHGVKLFKMRVRERFLSPDPAARFPSMRELLAALRDSAESVDAPTMPPPSGRWRWPVVGGLITVCAPIRPDPWCTRR